MMQLVYCKWNSPYIINWTNLTNSSYFYLLLNFIEYSVSHDRTTLRTYRDVWFTAYGNSAESMQSSVRDSAE